MRGGGKGENGEIDARMILKYEPKAGKDSYLITWISIRNLQIMTGVLF